MGRIEHQPHPPAAFGFEELFDAALHAQVIFDFDLNILAQNRRHEEMTGTWREAVVNRYMFDGFPKNPNQEGPDAEVTIRRSIETVRRTGLPDKPTVQRHDIQRGDGRFVSRHWQIVHSPIKQDGQVVAILQVSKDVTSEMRERALRQAQRNAAMVGAGITFFEYFPETDHFDRSERVDRMFGFEPDEAGPLAQPFFDRMHPDDLPGVRKKVEEVMGGDIETAVFDYRIIIPETEEVRHVRAIGEAVVGPQDGRDKLVGIFTDRTEDVRLQQRLAEAVEAKSAMLSEMNHRVRNSLALAASILRFQATGQEPCVSEPLEQARQRIAAIGAVHGRLYQDDSLDTIRMDRFLGDLLDDQCGSFDCEGRGIEIVKRLDTIELPTERAIPIGIILGEFVTNAFKYGLLGEEPGSLSVHLRQREGCGQLDVINSGSHGQADDALPSTKAGSRIMTAFAHQLGGELRSHHADDGTYTASLIFRLEEENRQAG